MNMINQIILQVIAHVIDIHSIIIVRRTNFWFYLRKMYIIDSLSNSPKQINNMSLLNRRNIGVIEIILL
jgi:hypothetical protein